MAEVKILHPSDSALILRACLRAVLLGFLLEISWLNSIWFRMISPLTVLRKFLQEDLQNGSGFSGDHCQARVESNTGHDSQMAFEKIRRSMVPGSNGISKFFNTTHFWLEWHFAGFEHHLMDGSSGICELFSFGSGALFTDRFTDRFAIRPASNSSPTVQSLKQGRLALKVVQCFKNTRRRIQFCQRSSTA